MKDQLFESPFSAQTYEEQQHRWLLWRSGVTDYCAEGLSSLRETVKPDEIPALTVPDPVPLPQYQPAANRHSQLDVINARHKAAGRYTGQWQCTAVTSQAACRSAQ